MRGRGVWRRAKVHCRLTPWAGGRAGAAIGHLGRRGGECRSALCRALPHGRMSTQLFARCNPLTCGPTCPSATPRTSAHPRHPGRRVTAGHGVQFKDAAKREVLGLLEAGAFDIVEE